jgi:hypothetical protein
MPKLITLEEQVKIFTPVKEAQQFTTVTSEQLLDVAPTEFIQPETIKSLPLHSKQSLLSSIETASILHKRPMADSEYDSFLDMIKTGQDFKGNIIFNYQKAALARIIKENYIKFFPQSILDNEVTLNLSETLNLSLIMKDNYEAALNNYRETFIKNKAEDVFEKYSPEEKQRFKLLGIAFTGSDIEISKKLMYTHPMLRYGLIRKK